MAGGYMTAYKRSSSGSACSRANHYLKRKWYTTAEFCFHFWYLDEVKVPFSKECLLHEIRTLPTLT